MNIFVLSFNPRLAARMQVDRHVVKMPLETAQLLSTVSGENGGITPYQPTHVNHPCTLWLRASRGNWLWLVEHGLALCEEYTRRYGREHASQRVIEILARGGGAPKWGNRTPFALAMPDEYKRGNNAVASYRAYYRGAKAHLATWKAPATRPAWW